MTGSYQINSPFVNLPQTMYSPDDIARLNNVNLSKVFATTPMEYHNQSPGTMTNPSQAIRGSGAQQAGAAIVPGADAFNLNSQNSDWQLQNQSANEQAGLDGLNRLIGATNTNTDVSPYISQLYNRLGRQSAGMSVLGQSGGGSLLGNLFGGF